MRFEDVPGREGWKVAGPVDREAIYEPPPRPPIDGYLSMFGFRRGDPGHCIYLVPAYTEVAAIVDYFEVGSHGAESYGYDAAETVALVARKVSAIEELVPGTIEFADAAGLCFRFARPITRDEVEKIEALYGKDEAHQGGLVAYMAESPGDSLLLPKVLEENLIRLWWD